MIVFRVFSLPGVEVCGKVAVAFVLTEYSMMLLLQMMVLIRLRIGNKPERAIDKQFVNHKSSVCVLSEGFTVTPHLGRLLPKRCQFETSEWDVTDTILYIQTVVNKHWVWKVSFL